MGVTLRQSTASQEVPLGQFVSSTDGNTAQTALTIANTDIKLWVNGATTLANKNSGGATHISNGIYYAILDATDSATVGPMVIFVSVAGALTVRLECEVLSAAQYDAKFGSPAYSVLTAAQIATGVWQDTTTGDFTVASSIGKSLYTTGNAPGAASGLALVGSNMGTVSSVTGNVGGNVVGSVASVTGNVGGSVASVVAGVTVSGTVTLADGSLTTAKLGTFVLAKTTNITGFNDIAATAIVSSGAITTSGGAVSTVTAVGTLTTYTGNTPQTGDSFARIGATGSGLTSIPTLTATQITTDHGAGSYIRNTEPLDAAGVRTAVGLATANLDTQLAALSTSSALTTVASSVALIQVQTDKLTFDGSNNVAADAKKLNSTTVNGTGVSGDLWRGA